MPMFLPIKTNYLINRKDNNQSPGEIYEHFRQSICEIQHNPLLHFTPINHLFYIFSISAISLPNNSSTLQLSTPFLSLSLSTHFHYASSQEKT